MFRRRRFSRGRFVRRRGRSRRRGGRVLRRRLGFRL